MKTGFARSIGSAAALPALCFALLMPVALQAEGVTYPAEAKNPVVTLHYNSQSPVIHRASGPADTRGEVLHPLVKSALLPVARLQMPPPPTRTVYSRPDLPRAGARYQGTQPPRQALARGSSRLVTQLPALQTLHTPTQASPWHNVPVAQVDAPKADASKADGPKVDGLDAVTLERIDHVPDEMFSEHEVVLPNGERLDDYATKRRIAVGKPLPPRDATPAIANAPVAAPVPTEPDIAKDVFAPQASAVSVSTADSAPKAEIPAAAPLAQPVEVQKTLQAPAATQAPLVEAPVIAEEAPVIQTPVQAEAPPPVMPEAAVAPEVQVVRPDVPTAQPNITVELKPQKPVDADEMAASRETAKPEGVKPVEPNGPVEEAKRGRDSRGTRVVYSGPASAMPPEAMTAAPPSSSLMDTTPLPPTIPAPLLVAEDAPSALVPAPVAEAQLDDKSRALLQRLPSGLGSPKKQKPKPKVTLERSSTPDLSNSTKTHKGVGISIEIKTPQRDAQGFLEQGYAALQAGDIQEAYQQYNAALQQEPENANAQFGVAATAQRLGQHEMARKLYTKLLQNNPRNLEALNNYLVLLSEDAPLDARQELLALEQRNPDFDPIPAQIAAIDGQLGDFPSAVANMQKAVSLAPENVSYRYNLAVLLDHGGFKQEGAEAYLWLLKAYQDGQKIPLDIDTVQQRLIILRSNDSSQP